MAHVIIGGRTIEVALPNFKVLKAAWRHIAAVQESADPMDGVDAIVGLIAVGAVGQALTVDEIEEALTPTEMAGLRPFVNQLMIETGLASGEATPAEGEASLSTATSTGSSPNSSPQAAETGTA
jgi:hypothetical protein